MVTEQEISQALQALIHDTTSNPNTTTPTFTTLNDVVQQLESRLGLDLSHKTDFIRAQIHFFFRSHPPTPQPQSQPQHQQQQQQHQHQHQLPQPQHPKDHFALNQPPNYHHPTPSAFQTFSSQPPPPLLKPEPGSAATVSVSGSNTPKDSAKPKAKRKGGPGAIVGHPTPRTEIVKQLWAYIRKNNLQDPGNKRKIICNEELRLVFETDCTDMFKMNKLLAKHILHLTTTNSQFPRSPRCPRLPWSLERKVLSRGDAPIRGFNAYLGIHKGEPFGGSSKSNGYTM
ncbi:upstream activation factor subunit spp27-like [Prunus yedoensis var. nudiflora]|uniref:Upstream activation factor subunit spp27-like n=1 Tax=Prunus yedoensis var. nudiflora TaxID=2094558 RepID=A0A314Z1Y8_PRUYE|nr:upstream activation factor subunit spp27-like [Prunus yedoensis var. nudiflora]